MKITQILLAEHAVFHNHFDHIDKSAPKLNTLAEIRLQAVMLEKLPRAHSETEDELFIAPLKHCFEHIGQRGIAHEEHEEIDRSLLDLKESLQVKTAGRL